MKPKKLLVKLMQLLTAALALGDMETAQAQIKGKGLISKMMKPKDVNPNLAIVGGRNAELGQFPHQIAIMVPNSNVVCCGGSLISSQWILTAAHCQTQCIVPNARVKAGMLDRVSGIDGESVQTFTFNVADFIPHEAYNGNTYINDIAVLKLDRPATINQYVQIIPLYLGGTKELEPETLRISGWGNIQTNVFEPAILQYVDVPIILYQTCKRTFNILSGTNSSNTNQVCAGSDGHNVCFGDSGGPVITMFGLGEQPYLVGVVSYVRGDGCEKPPGVHTRVSHYIDWIASKIGNQFPLYVYGTNLLLNAWGGTDKITNGSPVKLNKNAGFPASNELWSFNSDGTITTRTSSGGVLCLDSALLDGIFPSNHVPLSTCINNANQKWTWDRSTGSIQNTGTGYCLDASKYRMDSGTQVTMVSCNPNILGQRWSTTRLSAALFTSAGGRLHVRGALGPSSGNDWIDIDGLPTSGEIVRAMTWHINGLYAVSGGKLWKRNMNKAGWMDLGSIEAGTATSQVTAITSHFRKGQQQLVISKGDNLYAYEGGVWVDIGIGLGITGLVSTSVVRTGGMLNDTLYATTQLNQICKRIGNDVGNTWECYENSAYGIKGATILDGELFVAGSDDKIFKRGTVGVGPNTGNVWTMEGQVLAPTSLATIPIGYPY